MAHRDTRVILPDMDGRKGWRIFNHPVKVLAAYGPEDVLPVLSAVEQAVADGLQAAGFVAYEAASGFDKAFKTHSPGRCPLVWFGLFGGSSEFHFGQDDSFTLGKWQSSVSEAEYNRAIARIRGYLLSGDTYQVNYTLRLGASFTGSCLAFFRSLQASQRTGYSAFIETDDMAVCSVSPELFFTLDGDNLLSKPMKGTIKRGLTLGEDRTLSDELAGSEKNRAENVMIVDMVRNDMGRIAVAGSVTVTSLFEIEKYPTVFQMTSTIGCRTGASFTDIMKALFPCASITGAPKVRTMEIIRELEPQPRGIYTGSIGYLLPGRKAKFNVAIRTVVIDKKAALAAYGVGGGIVWDSSAASEYEECLLKAAVLKSATPEFSLLETMLWTGKDGYFLLDRHLARMAASAEYFDYRFDRSNIERRLDEESARFSPGRQRVRVKLAQDGDLTIESAELPDSDKRWLVELASAKADSHDVFLYHKTTNRAHYDSAKRTASRCDDVILVNERGEITESTVANVVVELNGEWLTPPVSCGLLAGIYREWLLEKGEIRERILTPDDLLQAEKVFLINSVRKWIPVDLDFPAISA